MPKKSIRAMTEIAHWLWMSKLRIAFLVRKVVLKDPPARTAGTPEVQADYAYADKNRKYKNVSHQNGLSFSPLIFESTGRMHKSTVAILRSFAKLAEEPLRIPKAVLYSYFIRRISCCLQRSIARAILTRVSEIKGRVSKPTRNLYYKS